MCLPSIASKYSSNVAWSWPPSAFPILLNHGFQVCPMMASKHIFILAQLWPLSASLRSVNLGLQVDQETCSIMTLMFISESTPSWSVGTQQIALKHRWLPVPIYGVYSSLLYRYIDENTNSIDEFWNHYTIGGSYDFFAHQYHFRRRCGYSQTALPSFELFPGLSSVRKESLPVCPGLWPACPGVWPACPGLWLVCSGMWPAPRIVASTPRIVTSTPRIVAIAPKSVAGTPRIDAGAPSPVVSAARCSHGCLPTAYVLADSLPAPPGVP